MLPERWPVGELRLPLLVTGVTGVAGFNALRHFQKCYPGQVVGIRPRPTWQFTGDGIIALEDDDADSASRLFRAFGFRSVLNCAGNCALRACEQDPVMARRINVAGAGIIAEAAAAQGCRLVHLSTDLVFSGTHGGNHVETDPVDPVSVYGKTMAEAERIIRRTCPGAAVLRISLPMGPSFSRHAGAIDWIDSRFRHGRPATLYFDEVRSSAYCDDLNVVFERFLAGEEHGIYHIGGPEPLALYQIGQIVNRVGGYAPELLRGCPRILAGPIPPRAGNVSMCSDRLIALFGLNLLRPWPLAAELVPGCRRWHHERAVGEVGSFAEIERRLYFPEREPRMSASIAS
jgi:dTDP-4-dehydrorhamnose reductase